VTLVAEEKILVVPTKLFHDLGYFQGFSRQIDSYWPQLVVGDHVEYQRGSGQGERRLHAKRSVGIGGHISSIDAETGHSQDVYREGMRRELEEEVIIDTAYTETVAGLINDDETPVGRVHLGMVHLCDVDESNVRPREADILEARFSPVADILTRLDQFESWSQIVVRALFG
jgi:predicted NUDIX family phosphoesterase